jgi:hypothetical protein
MQCRKLAARPLPHLLAVALLLAFVQPASAVVVYKLGEMQPIAGYFVRESDREVVLRQPREGGGSAEITVLKSEIEELIHTVDQARLATLDPARPQDYREYADELAEKKIDPEARDTALRLYVIAADLGSGTLKSSDPNSHEFGYDPLAPRAAMLGLIALARSPEEEARFRAAAYLADPRHDSRLLVTATSLPSSAPSADPAAKQKLLEAVHHARRGKGEVAARLIARPEIAAELAAASSIVSKEEFQRICRAKELDDDQLSALIKLELGLNAALSPPDTETTSATETARSWSQLLAKPQPPLRPLDLRHLTEFDPAQSVYREGKWVEP